MTTIRDLKRLYVTMIEIEESKVSGFMDLINAMTLCADLGMTPCADMDPLSELPNVYYFIYYDYQKGKGEHKRFELEELEEAAIWLKENAEREAYNRPDLIKNIRVR